MGTHHSVADARNHLSELIERASKGETVVITRHGTPVAELKAISPAPRRVTPADVEWLRQNLIHPTGGAIDAVALLREMNEESEEQHTQVRPGH